MNGKHASAMANASRRSAPNHISLYEDGDIDTKTTHRGAADHVALIRGTMLELVRRDGRDLTARQLTTLLTVYLQDEVHSVSSLARMLNISRPGVTRILDRLVDAELVSRAEDAADRRRVLVYRTPSGTQYMRDLQDVAEHVATELHSTEASRLS